MTRSAPDTCNGTPGRLILALALGLLPVACAGPQTQRQVPPELVGRWVTSHPDYVGRFFEITSSGRLTIGTGVEPPTSHAIVEVELDHDDEGNRLVTIVYLNDGEPIRFPLNYDPDTPDRVWPRHQSAVVWRRTEGRR